MKTPLLELLNTLHNHTKHIHSFKTTDQEALLEKCVEPLFQSLIKEERS